MKRFVAVVVATALVAVVASVSEAKAVEIKVSKSLEAKAGTEKQFVVELNRAGELRALTLRLADLPKGVTVKSVLIPSDKSKATVTLVLNKDAELVVSKKVKIFVESDDKAVSSSTDFALTIKKQ